MCCSALGAAEEWLFLEPMTCQKTAWKNSDEELVKAVCCNDQDAIVYFFYERYLPVFQYHILKIFPLGTEIRALVDEFFLYLIADNWRKLRTFDASKASLSTWVSVISFRFFKHYKANHLECRGIITISDNWESYAREWVSGNETGIRMDIDYAIDSITNFRDREIAKSVFIKNEEFKTVADRFGLSVDYIYTVKNRLVRLLKSKLSAYL